MKKQIEKKVMSIFKESKQTRTAIPEKFAKSIGIGNNTHKALWTLDLTRKKLIAEIIEENKIKEEEQAE